jgi:alpha-L-fucosidase
VVPTSKHHEGFTMWPSAQSWNWNSVDLGPKRDVMGELLSAARAAGIHPGMYFSLYEWYHPLYIGSDPQQYVQQIMIPQFYDLINTYKPEVFWTDGEWGTYATSCFSSSSIFASLLTY